jgi:hypothetical protein
MFCTAALLAWDHADAALRASDAFDAWIDA